MILQKLGGYAAIDIDILDFCRLAWNWAITAETANTASEGDGSIEIVSGCIDHRFFS